MRLIPLVALLTAFVHAETDSRAMLFRRLIDADKAEQPALLARIDASFRESDVPMILEVWRFSSDRELVLALIATMEKHTKQKIGGKHGAWFEWLWSREYTPDAGYAGFKSDLYARIDPRFAKYFDDDRTAKIRLDEVRWGGVVQDGIPPLRGPDMIAVDEAKYLADSDVVFGLEVEGDARAYPKRILAWHEMFVDTVGGVPVAGVYCTLCGSMILYETTHAGVVHELGTSGFLYRSNKLMYDKATQSMWSTLKGEPVIGPLADESIRLERRSVVTTTWGEWKRRHPKTKVLSLATGHRRDYSEGAAYRNYFATDRLMFGVPRLDKRLKNKDEVLALVFPKLAKAKPLAISAAYLAEHRVHHDAVGERRFVVLTDASGANRVYATNGLRFASWNGRDQAVDEKGRTWRVAEAHLTQGEERLARLPAHRAFWFGWVSAYPNTRLLK